MTARTEQLMQHGSVEAMVEAVLKRQGANRLEPIGGMFGGPDEFDDPEADAFDDEDAA